MTTKHPLVHSPAFKLESIMSKWRGLRAMVLLHVAVRRRLHDVRVVQRQRHQRVDLQRGGLHVGLLRHPPEKVRRAGFSNQNTLSSTKK